MTGVLEKTKQKTIGIREGVILYHIAIGEFDGTGILVELTGELDLSALEELRETFDAAAYLREPAIVDLSGVTFLDLLCARELAVRSHLYAHQMTLRNPSPEVLATAQACGLEEWLLLAPETGDRDRERTSDREPSIISRAV